MVIIVGAADAGVDSESIKSAVIEFQSWFGLDVNGEFDEPTLNLMNQPRCGDKGNEYEAPMPLTYLAVFLPVIF